MVNKIRNLMEKISIMANDLNDISIEFDNGDYEIIDMGCPHQVPNGLPKGYSAVYIFIYKDEVLKIGKVNEKSNSRFCHQHYGFNARSTLAKSICNDERFINLGITRENVKEWMLNNLQRVNIIIRSNKTRTVSNFIEAALQYALLPRFEGNI